MKMQLSRRVALKLFALGTLFGKTTFRAFAENRLGTRVAADFLSATLRWNYPNHSTGDGFAPYRSTRLIITTHPDNSSPVVSSELAEDEDIFKLRLPRKRLTSGTLTPADKDGQRLADRATGNFHTGSPSIKTPMTTGFGTKILVKAHTGKSPKKKISFPLQSPNLYRHGSRRKVTWAPRRHHSKKLKNFCPYLCSTPSPL